MNKILFFHFHDVMKTVVVDKILQEVRNLQFIADFFICVIREDSTRIKIIMWQRNVINRHV